MFEIHVHPDNLRIFLQTLPRPPLLPLQPLLTFATGGAPCALGELTPTPRRHHRPLPRERGSFATAPGELHYDPTTRCLGRVLSSQLCTTGSCRCVAAVRKKN
jgi:hypothetical protein